MTADAAPARPEPAPRKPLKHLGAIIFGVVVLAIVIFLILFRWNWLRGPLAHYISGRIDRPVHITGNLEVHPWSWSPRGTVNGLVIGNAPWAPREPLATLPRVTVQVKILPLLQGKVILPLVEADQPDVRLLRDTQGRENWSFHPGEKPKPLKLPAINNFIIKDGALRFIDVKHHIDFTGTIASNERVNGYSQGIFVLDGKGSLNKSRFLAHVTGGALVNVDPAHPYHFDARAEAGETKVRLVGSIAHPFNFGQLSGILSATGPDLADLYYLSGVTLPNSPPFSLTAGFGRDQSIYALRHLTGHLGGSDISGHLTLDDTTGRLLLTGDLASRRLRFADLTAVFGGAPKKGTSTILSPQQKIVAAKLTAEHRIFPDTHLDVSRVRAMDADVKYRADTVEAGKIPVRALSLGVKLHKGLLDLAPLDLTLPQGRVAGTVHIDARGRAPTEAVDLRLTNARLASFAASKKGDPPAIDGALFGHAKLTSAGDSIRAAAGGSNGAVTMVVTQGDPPVPGRTARHRRHQGTVPAAQQEQGRYADPMRRGRFPRPRRRAHRRPPGARHRRGSGQRLRRHRPAQREPELRAQRQTQEVPPRPPQRADHHQGRADLTESGRRPRQGGAPGAPRRRHRRLRRAGRGDPALRRPRLGEERRLFGAARTGGDGSGPGEEALRLGRTGQPGCRLL